MKNIVHDETLLIDHSAVSLSLLEGVKKSKKNPTRTVRKTKHLRVKTCNVTVHLQYIIHSMTTNSDGQFFLKYTFLAALTQRAFSFFVKKICSLESPQCLSFQTLHSCKDGITSKPGETKSQSYFDHYVMATKHLV
jgi:hypothetical protein